MGFHLFEPVLHAAFYIYAKCKFCNCNKSGMKLHIFKRDSSFSFNLFIALSRSVNFKFNEYLHLENETSNTTSLITKFEKLPQGVRNGQL